jgi:N-dimethylarginine dimethylaminohydrolase
MSHPPVSDAPTVYETPAALDFALTDCRPVPRPDRLVLTTPEHFDVEYVINPHMEGKQGSVDRALAWQQWKAVRAVYTALGYPPDVVEGRPGLPDMVFCANQSLPYYDPDTETAGVLLARMRSDERAGEVPHFRRFFREQGTNVIELPPEAGTFEGTGDARWHPGRHLLWCGHGPRTDRSAHDAIAERLGVRVLSLALADPDFYHLDTCLCPLDEGTALYVPNALKAEGRALVERFFDRLIEVPDDEARSRFACNAHCPDGRHVVLQEGSTTTETRLRDAGYVPVPVDTSEFIKAGGSVFCITLSAW